MTGPPLLPGWTGADIWMCLLSFLSPARAETLPTVKFPPAVAVVGAAETAGTFAGAGADRAFRNSRNRSHRRSLHTVIVPLNPVQDLTFTAPFIICR